MPGGTYCSVASCKNSTKKCKELGRKIIFFSFPQDAIICKQWVQKCYRKDKLGDLTYRKICSDHFAPEQFEDELQARLLGRQASKLKENDLLYNSERKVATIGAEEIEDENWPLKFFREYVSKNLPLLVKGGANSLASVKKWSSDYFLEKISDKEVTVAITPNGYADGINNIKGTDTFVLPEEKQMKMGEFLKILHQQKPNYICYIQKQNSNLTLDFPELLQDIDSEVVWASKAFGCKPEAVNFWMGDNRAITSMHKDHYENIYIVVDGCKDFILIPPVDLPKVPYKEYPVLRYKNVSSDNFEATEDHEAGPTIDWIAVDPLDKKSISEHMEFNEARQFHVRVEKGDILYLPSLWFHHVRQSHKCIAVNYWYDMDFQDLKYCYYKMVASLCGKETCT